MACFAADVADRPSYTQLPALSAELTEVTLQEGCHAVMDVASYSQIHASEPQ